MGMERKRKGMMRRVECKERGGNNRDRLNRCVEVLKNIKIVRSAELL